MGGYKLECGNCGHIYIRDGKRNTFVAQSCSHCYRAFDDFEEVFQRVWNSLKE